MGRASADAKAGVEVENPWDMSPGGSGNELTGCGRRLIEFLIAIAAAFKSCG